jgi:hypothetical protein
MISDPGLPYDLNATRAVSSNGCPGLGTNPAVHQVFPDHDKDIVGFSMEKRVRFIKGYGQSGRRAFYIDREDSSVHMTDFCCTSFTYVIR